MPFKPHPTDPDKMVYESRKYDFDPIEWRQHASAYEQGFIDGMQKQMQSSVDKAVNAMTKPTYYIPSKGQREWVGLTEDEIHECFEECCSLKVVDPKGGVRGSVNIFDVGRAIEAKLKERNT